MEGREDEMSGHGSLHGNFRCLDISDLADHDNVRILAQKGFERCSKGHAHLGIDIDLIDALEVELDRILCCQDFDVLGVERIKRRIEGDGFAGPGGASH